MDALTIWLYYLLCLYYASLLTTADILRSEGLTTNYGYSYYGYTMDISIRILTMAEILRIEGLSLAHGSRRVRHDMQSRRRCTRLITCRAEA